MPSGVCQRNPITFAKEEERCAHASLLSCSFIYPNQEEKTATPEPVDHSRTTKETIKSSLNMNTSSMYPIEAALNIMEVEFSSPWQYQWQQKSSRDLTDDFVNLKEEQHMTLPRPRREAETKYRFLPVAAFRRSSSISSSQHSVR
jgi:hypothetical protein